MEALAEPRAPSERTGDRTKAARCWMVGSSARELTPPHKHRSFTFLMEWGREKTREPESSVAPTRLHEKVENPALAVPCRAWARTSLSFRLVSHYPVPGSTS